MTVPPLALDQRRFDHGEGPASQLIAKMDVLTLSVEQATVEALLFAAKSEVHDVAWAAYGAGEPMYLLGHGPKQLQSNWPASITASQLDALCRDQHLHRWPAGRGEGPLGWLLAPQEQSANPALSNLALRLGYQLQTDALARAQITQRVLYEITYLASSTRDLGAFLQGIHRQLASLIDAENFYLALYDQRTSKITYPYYVDITDRGAGA
jgi:hypothetical protein